MEAASSNSLEDRDDLVEKAPVEEQGFTPSHAATIAAYESQLKSYQKLLNLQKIETKHSLEHNVILDQEVNALRLLVQEKQDIVHRLQRDLIKSREEFNDLKADYSENYIQKLALYDIEQQNIQLLERIKEKQAQVDELMIENRYLRELKEDNMFISEEKAKKMAELEIVYPFERSQLLIKVDEMQNTISSQQNKIKSLEMQTEDLRQIIKNVEEAKAEQLLRITQSQYKMILDLDEGLKEKREIEASNNTYRVVSEVYSQQAQELTAKLDKIVALNDTVTKVSESVIHTLEADHQNMREKSKLLSREHNALQVKERLTSELLNNILQEDMYAKHVRKSKGLLSKSTNLVEVKLGKTSSSTTNKLRSVSTAGSTRRSPLNKFNSQVSQGPRTSMNKTAPNVLQTLQSVIKDLPMMDNNNSSSTSGSYLDDDEAADPGDKSIHISAMKDRDPEKHAEDIVETAHFKRTLLYRYVSLMSRVVDSVGCLDLSECRLLDDDLNQASHS